MGIAGSRLLSLRGRLSARFWVELGLGVASAVFALFTLAWKDWIEIVFRVDPDHHSGELEFGVVAMLVVVTIIAGAVASVEWQRATPALE